MTFHLLRVAALTPSSVVVGRVDAATPFRGAGALLIRRGEARALPQNSMRGGYSSGTKNLGVDYPIVPLLESTRRRRPTCIRVAALTPSSAVVGRVAAATPFRGAAHC